MAPIADRWHRIEALYHAALELDPAARAAFLDGACGQDNALRREVESLLAESPTGEGLLDRPVAELLAEARTIELKPGTRLGSYRIEGPIGRGGMGEVYRATDTRLHREVAIKTSQRQFSERFAREAKVIASLNHTNICILHDVGPDYLVMEMIEGPTLAERIDAGAISLDQAAGIMRQVADALDYAHEKGVVHRDLKPANIKIRPNGVVKVLDFGLALVNNNAGAGIADAPTGLTVPGAVMGTAAYMAPEQAMGKPVDKRADVWAFGVVFYEMLAGVRMHKGKTPQEVMAAVLRDEPDLTKVSAQAHRLLKRCLEKDPNKRLRHVGDVMALLDEAPQPESPVKKKQKKWLWPVVAAAVIVAGAGLALWAPWRKPAGVTQAVRFEVGPSDKMTLLTSGGAMTVSPDGRWMAFLANGEDGVTRYWIRSLDGVEVRALPGTETAPNASPVAWSYDSLHLFFSVANKLKEVDLEGGPPRNLADLPTAINGVASNRDGVLIVGFTPAGAPSPLLRIPASGGVATPLTALAKGERTHRAPQFLPDRKHFLYQRVSNDPNRSGIYVGSLDVKPEEQSMQRVLASDRQAFYAVSPGGGMGHLIFLRETTLMAQPFDPTALRLSGEPVPIADNVDSFAGWAGLFAVSDTGTLVYREGNGSRRSLAWFDSQGNSTGTVGDPGEYANPAVSPDGTRVAVAVGPAANRDIWILEVARGTSTRFTFDPAADDNPLWSPDGKSVVFRSNRGGAGNLYIKAADGSGQERLLFQSAEPKVPESWSRDGRFLLFSSTGQKTQDDIWALPMHDQPQGEAKPFPVAFPVVQTPFEEGDGAFSPDGRWIAYTSNESDVFEIYVRPFSSDPNANGSGAKWMISKGGGLMPRWRADGRAIDYLTLTSQLMTVEVNTAKGFEAATPRRLSSVPPVVLGTTTFTGDGKRYLFVASPNGNRPVPYTVVVNWAAGLKK